MLLIFSPVSLSLGLCVHTTTSLFPTRLLYSGSVLSVDRKNSSFRILTFQWIEGSSVNDKLSVDAFLKPSKRCPFPYFRVPKVGGMVHFTGIVQHVQDRSLTVVVNMISFLNNKVRPSVKTLAMLSKLHHVSP